MKDIEDKFVHELEVFRTEVHSGIQFYYTYLAINSILSEESEALDIVNYTPLFWKTNLGALNTSVFIVMGRIFDQKSNHNIDKLLNIAQCNPGIFSSNALKARKIKESKNASEWIDDYMKRVYVPDGKDFRRLRIYVAKNRSIYVNNYRDIRWKIYAHKEISRDEDTKKLYGRANIRELEKLLIFLHKFYKALWELYYNGYKPTLRPMKYSVLRMKKEEPANWQIKNIQERMVNETKVFFKILSTCRPTTGWS